jgi:hypothetical protein
MSSIPDRIFAALEDDRCRRLTETRFAPKSVTIGSC